MINNCLFYAIYIKFKNPKNRKIIKIPKEINGDKVFSHYVTWDKAEDKIYHFVQLKKSKFPPILFKGRVEILDKVKFDCKVMQRINSKLDKIKSDWLYETKNEFESKYIGDWVDDGSMPTYDGGMPFIEKCPFVKVFYDDKNGHATKLVKLEPNKKPDFPKTAFYWSYLTPVDKEYTDYVLNHKKQ